MDSDLDAARRKRDSFVQTAISSREDSVKLVYLERAVEAAREADKLEAQRIAALAPCRKCGRKVTFPCHDDQGYYEGGPWDASCVEIFR